MTRPFTETYPEAPSSTYVLYGDLSRTAMVGAGLEVRVRSGVLPRPLHSDFCFFVNVSKNL